MFGPTWPRWDRTRAPVKTRILEGKYFVQARKHPQPVCRPHAFTASRPQFWHIRLGTAVARLYDIRPSTETGTVESPAHADIRPLPAAATDAPRAVIAVVDDDSDFARYLRTSLALRGYDARTYTRGDQILSAIRHGERPDTVLLDVAMPGMDGLQTLKALKHARPELQVIMLSGREQANVIVEAVHLGAADYLVKPDDPEGLGDIALDSAITQAIERHRLVNDITDLRWQFDDDQKHAFPGWSDSPAMRQVAQIIEQASDSDVTVLIRGETGVGKELVACPAARLLHAWIDEGVRSAVPKRESLRGSDMNLKETLEALAERLQTTGVRTIYGEPISAEGRTIIPVARVAYGFGGGGGQSGKLTAPSHDVSGEGAGGGGGVRTVPVGVVEITPEQTRFLRFDDWRPLAAAAFIGFGLGIAASKWAGRRSRRD